MIDTSTHPLPRAFARSVASLSPRDWPILRKRAVVRCCVAGRRRAQAPPAAWRNLHGRIETGCLQVKQEYSYISAIVARGLSQRPGPSAFGPKR